MRYALMLVVATFALAFINPSSALAAEGTAKPQVMKGYIRKVDLKAGTFVLGGKNERNTVFRFGVKRGEGEAAFYLDGKRASARNGFPKKSKASVTYVKVGDVLWALKVEITSPK